MSGYRISATNSSACEGTTLQCFVTNFYSFIIDIDECMEGSSGCSQICMNEPGDYNCSCLNGYILLDDDHSCEG